MIRYLAGAFLLLVILTGCEYKMKDYKKIPLPYKVLKTIDGVEIRQGGYGSSLFGDLENKDRFYALTDKGIEGLNPKIGHFEIEKNKIHLLKVVDLKARVNPEGLVVLRDKTFWISEEFENEIIHFDKKGNIMEKIDFLPNELKNFRNNKGFEGLAISKDEKTLFALMQSSLKASKKSRLTRLIAIDLKNKKISQYLYALENKKNLNSELRALDDKNFLVIERNSKNTFKKIYKISLQNATDIEKIKKTKHLRQDKNLGLLIKGKPLEKLKLKTLKKYHISPVQKRLILDLKDIDYPHDKPEGLWINQNTLWVLNDDDFAIKRKNAKIKQKFIKKNIIDRGTLYMINGLDLYK